MQIWIILAGVIVNFIIYLSFGSLLTLQKDGKFRPGLALLTGFFGYYGLFFCVCIPVMKYYRPLSLLTSIWIPIVAVIVLLALIFCRRVWLAAAKDLLARIGKHPVVTLLLVLIVGAQILIVTTSYHFTLDASYYVASVATNVETNMINVYDPFTGAWQDHFEMRYFFATYQVSDAVVCQLTGISPLVQTKSIMAAVVILLTNLVYYLIAKLLFADREDAPVWMLGFMFLLNLMFVTIYTSSLFLFTRTYEGKAIVGNLSILSVLYLFILLVREEQPKRYWLLLFLTCFGSTSVSSSANMLIPAEMAVLYLPEILISRRFGRLVPLFACMVPGVTLALAFVLYVKGYFVFYTYPVW